MADERTFPGDCRRQNVSLPALFPLPHKQSLSFQRQSEGRGERCTLIGRQGTFSRSTAHGSLGFTCVLRTRGGGYDTVRRKLVGRDLDNGGGHRDSAGRHWIDGWIHDIREDVNVTVASLIESLLHLRSFSVLLLLFLRGGGGGLPDRRRCVSGMGVGRQGLMFNVLTQ
ncbi:hypothetical protein BaRGS_00032840, partial [Batillaria attramentaria]